MENEFPKHESLETVLSYFQTRPDIGGFVVQKTNEEIEFDAYFSDEFLGQDETEACSTMIVVIAAMRNMADSLTKKMVEAYKLDEKKVRESIADLYYQLQKDRKQDNEESNESNG